MNAGCHTRVDVPPSTAQRRALSELPTLMTCCNSLQVLHGLKRLGALSLKAVGVGEASGRHSSEILLSQGHCRGMSSIKLVWLPSSELLFCRCSEASSLLQKVIKAGARKKIDPTANTNQPERPRVSS